MPVALSALAELAHSSLRGPGRAAQDGLAAVAGGLRRVGLRAGVAIPGTVSSEAAGAVWVDAAPHLLVGLELHQEVRTSAGA